MHRLWKGSAEIRICVLRLWRAERRTKIILNIVSKLIVTPRSRREEPGIFVSLIFGSRFLDMNALTKAFKNRDREKRGSVLWCVFKDLFSGTATDGLDFKKQRREERHGNAPSSILK
jgi:hypothetical protein